MIAATQETSPEMEKFMGIRKFAIAAFAAVLVGLAGLSLAPSPADARHGWQRGASWGQGPGARWRANRRWQRRHAPRWRRAPVARNYRYHGIRPFRPIRRLFRGLHRLVHPFGYGGYR